MFNDPTHHRRWRRTALAALAVGALTAGLLQSGAATAGDDPPAYQDPSLPDRRSASATCSAG